VVDGKCITCNKRVDSSDDGSNMSNGSWIYKGKNKKKEMKGEDKKYDGPEKEEDPYPEINVPMEYISKFEMLKDFSPG
jgi:hypothetical protein